MKKGDKVIWRTGEIAFLGEVDVPGKRESYVLFPNREHPTGGHWLGNDEIAAVEAVKRSLEDS